MISNQTMRGVLWADVVFNGFAALLLSFPSTLGTLVGLPPSGTVFYPWLLAFFIALFGAAYAWLALQPTFSRPFITLAVFGKCGVFVVALACLLRGDIQFRTFSVTIGDLAFGIFFFLWLRSTA
jgi:hypothetical protein